MRDAAARWRLRRSAHFDPPARCICVSFACRCCDCKQIEMTSSISSDGHGVKREIQVRDIAAKLGVADFVYSAHPVKKGAGQREASGDGLLLTGESGAILQVKARDPTQGATDSAERAAAWIRKHAAKATKQGRGTRRELSRRQNVESPMIVYPVRATGMTEDAKERYALKIDNIVEDWPIIVILDHPRTQEVDLGFQDDLVCFTFTDWWHILLRLRSIAATLNYVKRILRDGVHVPLGHEKLRYSSLLLADQRATEGSATSVTYLADVEGFDKLGADIFHDVIDKVWPDDGIVPWQSASEYRSIVEFLDAVPPRIQSEIGRWMLKKRSEIAGGRHIASGLVRLDFGNRLVFACSHFRRWSSEHEWMAQFALLTNIRHIQAFESGAPNNTVTLDVGALVEDRSGRRGVAYTFVLQKGSHSTIPVAEGLRRNFEWRYGVYNHAEGTTLTPEIELAVPCPCLSGKTFGSCCGAATGGG